MDSEHRSRQYIDTQDIREEHFLDNGMAVLEIYRKFIKPSHPEKEVWLCTRQVRGLQAILQYNKGNEQKTIAAYEKLKNSGNSNKTSQNDMI